MVQDTGHWQAVTNTKVSTDALSWKTKNPVILQHLVNVPASFFRQLIRVVFLGNQNTNKYSQNTKQYLFNPLQSVGHYMYLQVQLSEILRSAHTV